MILLDVPGEPIAKGRPRFSRRNGRAFTPQKTRTAEDTFAGRVLALVALRTDLPLRGALAVTITCEMPLPASWPAWRKGCAMDHTHLPVGRPDIDNLAKLVTDACNGVLWLDDAQIVRLMVTKEYGMAPRTVIRIDEMVHVTSNPAKRAAEVAS